MKKSKDAPRASVSPWKKEAPYAGIRLLIGALFIIAGFSKALYPPEAFAAALEAYRLFPDAALMPVALVLPWAELILGAFFLCGYFTRESAAGLALMIVGYLGSLGSVITRRVNLYTCGCYGKWGPKFTPGQAFMFDLLLLTGVLLLAWKPKTPFSLDAWIETPDTTKPA